MKNQATPYLYMTHIIWGIYAFLAMILDQKIGLLMTIISVAMTWLMIIVTEKLYISTEKENDFEKKRMFAQLSYGTSLQMIFLISAILAVINIYAWYQYYITCIFFILMIIINGLFIADYSNDIRRQYCLK